VIITEEKPDDVHIDKIEDFPASFTKVLVEKNEKGGGWTNAGRRYGCYYATVGQRVWQLRCASCTAWGCQARAKLVVDFNLKKMYAMVATGIPHKHEGDKLTARGLPPQVKDLIKSIVGKRPRTKLKYARPITTISNHHHHHLQLANQPSIETGMVVKVSLTSHHTRTLLPEQCLG